MNNSQLNPTGFEVRLDEMIPISACAPSPEQSHAILVTLENVPKVLFWLDRAAWDDEAGNLIDLAQIDRWVYLR